METHEVNPVFLPFVASKLLARRQLSRRVST